MVEIGKTENLHLLLEKLLLPDLADSVIDELLYCVSELCHAHDLFYTFYPLLRKNPAEQDRVISFVAEQQKLEPDRRRQLLDLFDALLHSDQRCIELLSSVDALIKRMPCIQSITSFLDHHPHGDTKPVRMMVFLSFFSTPCCGNFKLDHTKVVLALQDTDTIDCFMASHSAQDEPLPYHGGRFVRQMIACYCIK